MVEELWLAGAEAVAVNGERVTAVHGGRRHRRLGARQLGLPRAAVRREGDRPGADVRHARSRRPASSTSSAAASETFGIGVGYAVLDQVDLDAYAGSVNLRYGRVDASPSPGAAPSDAARPEIPDAPALGRSWP